MSENSKLLTSKRRPNNEDQLESQYDMPGSPKSIFKCCKKPLTGSNYLFKGNLEEHLPPKIFILGPHWYVTIITYGMIIGANFLFSLLVIMSNPTYKIGNFIVPTFGLATITVYTLLIFSNPGIAPANLTFEAAQKFYNYRPLRKCTICHAYIPSHTYHCEYCDVCIEDLDHHCPWTGKCIGKYNFCLFNVFLVLVVLNILIILIPILFMKK